jgi:hypothetical protein
MDRSYATIALASLVLAAATPACIAASGPAEQAEPEEQSPRVGTAEAAVSSLTLIDDFTSGPHFERLTLNSSTTTQTGSMLWGARSTQLAGSFTPSNGAWGGLYIGAPSFPLLTVSTSNPVNGALVLTYVKPSSAKVLDLTSGGTATRLGITFQYNVGTTINPIVSVFDDVHGNRCEGGVNVSASNATSFPAYIDFSSLTCVGPDGGVPTWNDVGTQVTRIVVELQSEAVGCDQGGNSYALSRIMACSPTQCG